MRVVVPEILDHLPAEDPRAIRSRRDLRLINHLMGNDRWILRTLGRFPEHASRGITELGAGDGTLIRKIADRYPAFPVTAIDLAPPPCEIPANLRWLQGDLFAIGDQLEGGILLANLFLHHFGEAELDRIGSFCSKFDVLIFSEPARGKMPHLQGTLLHPLVNHVTRHDMHVSIDAGFIRHELINLLGLTGKIWRIEEHSTWRGALRVLAFRI